LKDCELNSLVDCRAVTALIGWFDAMQHFDMIPWMRFLY
jgi:hypothetical protein